MTSKTRAAYRQIKHLIESGDLAEGERLTVARASELVGIGPAPVRESILRLEGEGLLKHKGARRSRVVAYAEDQEPEEMLRRYELREAIEGTAARLAAKNMNGWQIDQLRELAHEMEGDWDPEDRDEHYEVSREFHHFLLAHCGNGFLLEIWQSYRLTPVQPRSPGLHAKIAAEAARGVSKQVSPMAVVDAIAAHDQDDAERLMRQWVRAVTEAIRRIVMAQAAGGKPGKLPYVED